MNTSTYAFNKKDFERVARRNILESDTTTTMMYSKFVST